MASLFPPSPPLQLSPALLRVYQAFKSLPEDYSVWLSLTQAGKLWPDLLVLNEKGQALLIKVSLAASTDAVPAGQLTLLGEARPALGRMEAQALESFERRLCKQLRVGASPVATVVVFPNLVEKQLRPARPPAARLVPYWLGRECLRWDADAWQAYLSAPVEPQMVDGLRTLFTPEAVVTRPGPEAATFLLNTDQEKALKTGLYSRQAGNGVFIQRVQGEVGRGKTTVLLCRLRLLHQLHPTWRCLALAGNTSSAYDLQTAFDALDPTAGKAGERKWFMVTSLLDWCRDHWPQGQPFPELIPPERRQAFLRAVWRPLFKETSLSGEDLGAELEWIKAQAVWSRAAYQAAPLLAGHRYPPEMQEKLYTAFERYQAVLKEKRLAEPADVIQRMLAFIQTGRVQPAAWNAILTDDAHNLSPLDWELVRKLLPSGAGELFVTIDPSQGWLGKGMPWSQTGWDKVSRTLSLT